MHFACSRCAHRQAEDAQCAGCGNDVVQDLRDRNGRRVLREAESRWQRKRHARFISIGALVGLLLFMGVVYVSLVLAPGELGESAEAYGRAAYDANGFAASIAAGGGIATIAILEATLGSRRRYPYLDDYENQPGRSPYR